MSINRQAKTSPHPGDLEDPDRPVVALMTPEITEEKVVELVQTGAEWDEFSADDLQRIVSELIEKSAQ